MNNLKKRMDQIRLHSLKLFVFLSGDFGTCCLLVYIRPAVRQASHIALLTSPADYSKKNGKTVP
jgi:hypothetical protein